VVRPLCLHPHCRLRCRGNAGQLACRCAPRWPEDPERAIHFGWLWRGCPRRISMSFWHLVHGWALQYWNACQILQDGRTLTFINEKGGQSAGKFVDSSTVVASDWQGLIGGLNDGGKRINWANGSWWVRQIQGGNEQLPGTTTGTPQGGCHVDPDTGQINCIDRIGDFANPEGSFQGGCYTDPATGQMICIDTAEGLSGVDGYGDKGCFTDPDTGITICID